VETARACFLLNWKMESKNFVRQGQRFFHDPWEKRKGGKSSRYSKFCLQVISLHLKLFSVFVLFILFNAIVVDQPGLIGQRRT